MAKGRRVWHVTHFAELCARNFGKMRDGGAPHIALNCAPAILAKCGTALVCFITALACAGEGEWKVPETLQPWKYPAYAKRFFLEVRPPSAAGGNLLPDPATASVLLPLKAAEPLLLLKENGDEAKLLAEQAGSEVRILFATNDEARRFCLYAAAANPDAKRSHHLKPSEFPAAVRMRGFSAASDFIQQEGKPLTLERFLAQEKLAAEANLGPRDMPLINNPECPYFKIQVGIFGHVGTITNPPHYTAVYEALLRVPVPGDYKFALDTLGAAHLLIDGKRVLSAEHGDPARLPFALTGTAEKLREGVHRLTLYYTEASPAGKTNEDLGLFGLRLHWRPPFAEDFLCIPAQAFVQHLPAVVTRLECGNNLPQPFIHIENLGQVLAGAYRGDKRACERVMLVATPVGGGRGALINDAGPEDAAQLDGGAFAAWVPAGREVALTLQPPGGQLLASRTVVFPELGKTAPELLDLEGEFTIKSAPDFLHPDETVHIHLETLLSPQPVIIPKERQETLLLPPQPRPMGQFRLNYWVCDPSSEKRLKDDSVDATPLGRPRCRQRYSFETAPLETLAMAGKLQIFARLYVGGAEVDTLSLRLLHAEKAWPGTLQAGPDCLLFSTGTPDLPPEHVIMLVPKESESEYRKFWALKRLERKNLAKEALFVGDPLVEGVAPKPNAGELFGVAKLLAAALPDVAWKGVCTPGPHRHLPIFRMIADVEAYTRAQPNGQLPALAVVCLGGGDVDRQTPLYTFERALDVLIARLRLGGVKTIVVAGVVPAPAREKQCKPYHDRVAAAMQQHHIECVDIYNTWLRDDNWMRYYKLEGAGDSPVYGSEPNAQAREAIVKMIKNQL
ncbi:MAG: GDSL-type esterase/lipase family protein [Planctomycetota bacterium]